MTVNDTSPVMGFMADVVMGTVPVLSKNVDLVYPF